MSDVATQIMQDYPSFAFLLNDPEIGPLLLEAVDPNKGFDAATFQAKLLQTNWWKTHNVNAREWLTLLNTDPAQAQAKRDETSAQVRQAVAQAGLYFTEEQLAGAVDMSLQLGVPVTSPTFRSWMGTWAAQNPGSVANLTGNLKGIAEHDYLMPIDQGSLNWWSGQIAAGEQTEANFRATYARAAADKYSAFATEIGQSIPPGQLFAPYRSTIANELELGSADQVDLLNDPRWSKILGVPNGNSGQLRPMTQSEVIQLARSQPEWGNTNNARAQGADLTQNLLKTFGARA